MKVTFLPATLLLKHLYKTPSHSLYTSSWNNRAPVTSKYYQKDPQVFLSYSNFEELMSQKYFYLKRKPDTYFNQRLCVSFFLSMSQ